MHLKTFSFISLTIILIILTYLKLEKNFFLMLLIQRRGLEH